MGKIKDHHEKIRAEASERIFDLYEELVKKDVNFQKSKPEVIKQIDDSLNTHIFDKIFK